MFKPTRIQMAARTARIAALAAGVALGATSATASPVNILALGDSLSNGFDLNAPGSNTKPYIFHMQNFLIDQGFTPGVDFDFIGGLIVDGGGGTLSNGSPADIDRWGRNGALASSSPSSNPFVGNGLDLVSDLQNATFDNPATAAPLDGVFSGLNAAGNAREAKVADRVLLHIGTNPLLGDSDSNPRFTDDSVDEADGQFQELLVELRNQWDAGNIANDAKIIVAKILPKADNSGGGAAGDDDTVRNTAIYNDRIDAAIAGLSESTADDIAFKALFSTVDMFEIDATDAGFAAAFAGDLGVIDVDADPYVDWVDGLNEAAPAIFSDPSVTVNGDLMSSDKIHLSNLGYEIMGYQFAQAVMVPEPTSLALLAIGAGMAFRRRRA